jgi:hypothetical protein
LRLNDFASPLNFSYKDVSQELVKDILSLNENFKLELQINIYMNLRFTAGGIRHADHVAPSIRTSWHSLRRQAAVARSV